MTLGRVGQTVLVVAAHPDDEVLGCGGTLRLLADRGDDVHVLFLGDGVTSRGTVDPAAIAEREAQALQVSHLCGFHLAGFERLPDNRFDSVDLLDIVQRIERVAATLHPRLVFTHHFGDLNIDHRRTCEAVLTAFRPLPHATFSEILAFEVPSATEFGGGRVGPPFVPDTWVDIDPHLALKLRAYKTYTLEVPRAPHARSVEAVRALAVRRGTEAGVNAAEAFVTLRRVIRVDA